MCINIQETHGLADRNTALCMTATRLQGDETSEWDEAEKDVKAAEAAKAKQGSRPTNGKATGKSNGNQQDALSQLFSPVFLEAFVLTFCAEWGDRSQIATIGELLRHVT